MLTNRSQFESAYGFQTSSLLDLYEDLKEANVFSDFNLKWFTLNGNTRSKQKKSFYALLMKPNENFLNELQQWISANDIDIEINNKTFYETEGTPLMILHDVRRIKSTWEENLRFYIMNIMKRSQSINYEYSETVFDGWKDKDKEQVKKEFLILMELLDNTVYIHEGYRFPTYNPQIINQGKKFQTHLIEVAGYYWPVDIHFVSRGTIKKFYDYPLNRRYKFSLTQSDWTRPLMIDLTFIEVLQNSEEVSEILESSELGVLENVNCDRQEALILNNYTNVHLGFESLKKIIPISYLQEKNINLIPVFPTKIKNQGMLGSYYFSNGQLKVQILVTNKQGEWNNAIRKKNYNEVVSQFQDEHLVLCPNCKKYLLTDLMKDQHKLTCQKEVNAQKNSNSQEKKNFGNLFQNTLPTENKGNGNVQASPAPSNVFQNVFPQTQSVPQTGPLTTESIKIPEQQQGIFGGFTQSQNIFPLQSQTIPPTKPQTSESIKMSDQKQGTLNSMPFIPTLESINIPEQKQGPSSGCTQNIFNPIPSKGPQTQELFKMAEQKKGSFNCISQSQNIFTLQSQSLNEKVPKTSESINMPEKIQEPSSGFIQSQNIFPFKIQPLTLTKPETSEQIQIPVQKEVPFLSGFTQSKNIFPPQSQPISSTWQLTSESIVMPEQKEGSFCCLTQNQNLFQPLTQPIPLKVAKTSESIKFQEQKDSLKLFQVQSQQISTGLLTSELIKTPEQKPSKCAPPINQLFTSTQESNKEQEN